MALNPESSKPKFKYDSFFNKYPVQYSLKVDENAVSSFFTLAGIPDWQKRITTVSLIKELPEDADYDDCAAYCHSDRNLEIYVDSFWSEYRKSKLLADRVIQGNKAIKSNDFHYLLGTRQMTIDYLTSAPAERAKNFIDKLLLRAVNRKINTALLHEIQHVRDHNWVARLDLIDGMFDIVGLGRLWYRLDPLERRANRFEHKMMAKAMERPMALIIPK